MKFFRNPLIFTLSLLSALTLSSCGGGGGGLLGSIGTALSGLAIDGPLPLGTIIYITNGAPYGQSGASNLGTLTVSAANGAYSGSVTLSSSGAPVFATLFDSANANVPGMMMTSFLGIDTALGSAGTLNSTTLHELDITPVTTAAVSVYYALNSNYTLTPATYATLIQTYNTDILAIAAGIKSVGDTACAPSAPAGYSGTYISTASGATNNLGALITSYVNTPSGGLSSTASASVTVGQVSTFLGASCGAYLNTMQTQIQASSVFGPQLLHESTETSLITATTALPSFTGTFSLSGLIAETGVTAAGAYVAAGNNAATVYSNSAVTIASNGAITSTDSAITGNLLGNQLTLNITVSGNTYTLSGRISSDLQISPAAYLIQAAGASSTASTPAQVLTNFNGVFTASGAAPLWNSLSYAGFTSGASLGGITCGANTFPLRLSTSGILPLSVVGECVAPASGTITASTSPVWAMTAPTTSVTTGVVSYHLEGNEYVVGVPASPIVNPASMTSGNWTEYSNSNPFVLTAQVTYANTSTNPATSIAGTAYYVVGSSNMVFVATTAPVCAPATTCNLSPNGLLTLGNNELHATGVVAQTVSGYTSYHGLGEMNGR
jgi:hypothetical protein